ncbi:hypothetical protein D3C76_1429490 [compost metagenome]
MERDGFIRGEWRRERNQFRLVVALVRECDEALVAAAIVPVQVTSREVCTDAFIQDAFQISFSILVFR